MSYREPNALRIRVALAQIEPAIWRRLTVPLSWHLGQLHLCIQATFNWWNYHLHEFRIGGLRYGDPEADDGGFVDGPRVFDEREVRLRDFDCEPGTTFTYLYDFGDDWHHTLEIEELLALDATPRFASCIDGARARPPEDVGGIAGYENFLAAIADRKHPEHVETKRWCGGHFDPEWFDLTLTDKDVKNALKPNVRRRLHQPKPKRANRTS
jgi:hypothetical protein